MKNQKTILPLLIVGLLVVFAPGCSQNFGPGSGMELPPEPEGPGSGEELPYEPEPDGPGSGEELPYEPEPEGPGSGEELPYEPEPDGPGSGEELPYEPEPTGPGSGEELPYEPEPTGPGSGEELPYVEPEPTGPGSGEELPYEPEPTGPGSGEELPYEPDGPGSGEEISQEDYYKDKAVGSCDVISTKSTCVEYIGSMWQTVESAMLNCSGTGTWSKNPCPRPTVGGCHGSDGTPIEIVIWHYDHGGQAFTPEDVPYAARACNELPITSWIFGTK